MELYDVFGSHYGAAVVRTGQTHHRHKKKIAEALPWREAANIAEEINVAHANAVAQCGDDFGSKSDIDGGAASNRWHKVIEKYGL